MDSKNLKFKLNVLDKRIKAFAKDYRQNIAVLGNDNEEISYLIEDYLQKYKLTEITYIYTRTAYAGKKEFFKAITFSLLNGYTNKTDTLDNLINYASMTLRSTTDFIKETLQKENLSFLDTLEVINKFINESNRHCVLIIEDFLGLSRVFSDFYQDFSKFIILQRKCMVVLTSSRIKDAQKILSGELNLLFGNFEKINLSENSSLENFIYLKNSLSPIKPSPFFLSFFVKTLGSNSIYYDLFSEIIKNKYSAGNELNCIISIIEKALYSKQTYFFQKFIKKIDLIMNSFKDPIPTMKIIFSLAQGYLRKKELASLGICNPTELSSRLQKLIDLNHIDNLGNIYQIKDSLFSFWLTTIFKFHFSLPALEPKSQKTLYRKEMEEQAALFKDEFYKDTIQKVLQLFSSFKDDVLHLGKTSYRLPLVKNAKIISYREKGLHLLIGEGKEVVFAGIKENNTQDSDIIEFIEKGANIKGKKVKKIFISFDKPSAAARLIAKNNKLIMWDIDEINSLFNVYSNTLLPAGLEND